MAFSFRKIWQGLNIVPKLISNVSAQGDMDVTSTNGKLNYHDGTTSSPMVTEGSTATLTNKSIDGGSNTVTGLTNSSISASAAIDATKLAAGSVDNTEFGYLDGVTSSIQTQLNAKADTSGTQTFSNKTLDNTNIITVKDSNFTIQDNGDTTKQFKIEVSGVATGNTRTMTVPDASYVVVGDTTTQNITNKTFNNTNIITVKDSNFTLNDDGDVTKQAVFQLSGITTGTTRTLTLPDVSITVVGNDNTATLTNKTISGASNTITNVSLTTGVTGTLPLGNGGTGQTTKAAAFDALSPMTTGGDLIYGGASGTGTRLANGSSGQVLTSTGSTTAPAWQTPTSNTLAAPTLQKFTSGSSTYNKNYTFIITSGSATVGATYTNNAVTFTVYATVASATQVVMSGSGAPTSSGTLTKATGTGDATLAFSSFLAPLYLIVEAVGAGGGGAGGGSASGTLAGAGGNTTFGSSLITCNGGAGGVWASAGGAGGTATLGTGALGLPVSGGDGSGTAGVTLDAGSQGPSGGSGGPSAYGGAGGGAVFSTSGTAGKTNSGGGGGGGGGGTSATNNYGGPGGGAGGYVKAIITAPSATYAVAIGAAGTAGGAGTGTSAGAGAPGGSGSVVVFEYYQ